MIAYLRLVRLPNVFTALADGIAGFVLIRSSVAGGWPDGESYASLAGVCVASASLYLSGMAFNDLADREEDARVRPNRPIPSGKVSLKGAALCGAALMLVGLGAAALVSVPSLICAAILAVCILTYDFGAKGVSILGPVVLGFCRFFNVVLATSSHPQFWEIARGAPFIEVPWTPALVVGVYAAGLTAFSSQEEGGRQKFAILTGWVFCGGALLLAAIAGRWKEGIAVYALIAATLFYFSLQLLRTGTPIAARNLVRTGVMGICVLDAGMIVGFAGITMWPWALACVALLVPGLLIGKWLSQREA